MRITSIDLISGQSNVARFSFNDPSSNLSYVAKGITGLATEEIIARFYGTGTVSGRAYYTLKQEPREVVLRLGLNPDYSRDESFSDLRDDIYKAVASSRTGLISLYFNDGAATVAAVTGSATKVEASYFTDQPELQVTISCKDPTLRALAPTEVDISSLSGSSFEISDGSSTAPHGFKFDLTFLVDTPNFWIRDSNTPDWEFKITPGTLGAYSGFKANDMLRFSNEYGNKYLYVQRPGVTGPLHVADKVEIHSVWPLIFPNVNPFVVDNPSGTKFVFNSVTYVPAYWGV